ncbi:DUF1501 domain-containing protein [Schlesneria paludicola]|uniref:DUF1501 domain-containing protein n=1 Tax=Schlesneria paludicola TaxID=360056 RepID=UPI00029AE7CB|nr:DUF1501 domain-containing protein [Schlesneria paludicola]
MTLNCQGPRPRREFLKVGALALGNLSLSQVLTARAAAGKSFPDTSVIMLYLHGGPSQLETYDLKPAAPTTYRSMFNPISTNVAGMDICELFPRQAQIADKFSLVRSLHHDIGIHSDGGIIVLTGKRPRRLDPTSQSKSDHPDFGSVASRVRGMGANSMPPYVAIPQKLYMTQPAYLGVNHGPFEVGDPSPLTYTPPALKLSAKLVGQGLDDRKQLLGELDRLRGNLDLAGSLDGTGQFRDLAFQMLTSPRLAEAFDLQREDPSLRDRYGRNLWGQGCLLARRMAEAGTAVVTLYIDTPKSGPDFTNWDDHNGNAGRQGHFAGYMRTRLPYLDDALATLIEDIFARGLDRKIMVVVVGEFGRTPRIATNSTGAGRDHWPDAYTALFSGGGLRMGQVVGATNSKAEFPIASPYTPYDMLATIYRHLGIDTQFSFLDFSGRPVPILGQGQPIRELI